MYNRLRTCFWMYRKICPEFNKVENYEKALANEFYGWVLHHRRGIDETGHNIPREEMVVQGLYFNRPPEELIFVTRSEHRRLHNSNFKGKPLSDERRKRLSEVLKGRKFTAEHKERIAEAARQRWADSSKRKEQSEKLKDIFLNPELREKRRVSKLGTHWWNNGSVNKLSRDCPGEGFERGKLT